MDQPQPGDVQQPQQPVQNPLENVMNQLVQTSQAAIRAAETANALAAQITSSSTSSTSGPGADDGKAIKDLYKLLQKPNTFAPENREQEVAQWRDWLGSVRQYLAAVNVKYKADIDLILKHPSNAIDMDTLEDDKQERSVFLYSFLSGLLKGRSLTILRNIGDSNGLEALRNLVQTFQPSSKSRSLAIMNSMMAWGAFDMRQALLPQILKLEDAFNELARVSDPSTDALKLAVLTRSLSGQLKTYVNVHLDEGADYETLRDAVLRFDRSNTKWTSAAIFGNDPKDEVVPMEIDRVKGKSKSKGKGNDNGKGKGDGKGKGGSFSKGKFFDAGKGKQEGKGSYSSYGSYGNFSQGYGKGKSEKGKGEKGKGKDSKGKNSKGQYGNPWNYNQWNYGKSNWNSQGGTVRQVEEQPQAGHEPQASSSTTTAAQASKQQVRRLVNSAAEDEVSPMVFDLTSFSLGEPGSHVCRMVSMCLSTSSCMSRYENVHTSTSRSTPLTNYVEYFDIGVDDGSFDVPPVDMDVMDLTTSCWLTDMQTIASPHVLQESQCVRMVQVSSIPECAVEIVIDSGSDASVLPQQYADCGVAH